MIGSDKASINAISVYLPPIAVSNEKIASEHANITPADIFKKTGIKTRYKIEEGTLASDMAVSCAEKFFSEHAIEKSSIDFLIYCTEAPDYIAPATACALQHRIGLSKNCGAFDVLLGCSGYLYGLSMATAFVNSGMAKNVLFITSDLPSTVVHPDDVELVSLFGDAASVSLISKKPGLQIGEFAFGTDGSGEYNLRVKSSCFKEPKDANWFEENKNANGMKYGRMEMNSMEIFTFSLREVPGLVKKTLELNQVTKEDIDLFVFHQPNGFMLEYIRRKLNIPTEKFMIFLEQTGNTVSATIPICLDELKKTNKLKNKMKIMIAGFGIGYSWSATVVEYNV